VKHSHRMALFLFCIMVGVILLRVGGVALENLVGTPGTMSKILSFSFGFIGMWCWVAAGLDDV
jgi:ABC-type enterochelin transport system permease subunit